MAEASTEEILSKGFFKGETKAKTEEAVVAAPVVNTSNEAPMASAEGVQTAVNTEGSSPVTAESGVTDESNDLLRLARSAYWAGDLDASIAHYQKLIAEQPDVISHKGELANVFWKQGAPEKAASLYADIAMPLIDLGKVDQVKTMNDFIGQFLPERAKDIAAKLHP